MIQRLLAGSLDGRQAIGRNASEDGDHLPITVMDALQPTADFLHGRWQNPFPRRPFSLLGRVVKNEI
ncbi:hypothetical protein FB006_14814 [Sinorhizobium medicae]|nr:hypothetical protein FB006_14814 [Sinorhizobium medicae]